MSSLASVLYEPKAPSDSFRQALKACRDETLSRVVNIQPELLKQQAHPDFSPVGWHLGHIAYIESFWILERLVGQPCAFPEYRQLFAADGLPKAERENLPDLQEILSYLEEVRSQTLKVLSSTDPSAQAPLWHWLLQHESQHAETVSIVLALHSIQGSNGVSQVNVNNRAQVQPDPLLSEIDIPAGYFVQGWDEPAAIDNEKPAHAVWLESYTIDRYPVTSKQYRSFIEAGGYRESRWWTAAGWQWKCSSQAEAPLYWSTDTVDHQPVWGVSWYEADAYARFVGKRLPTESEWARAAQTDDTQAVGIVWEWTDTWFDAYPGFRPFPYAGYSQVYFDQAHRVLRGGSFATPQWALRKSFRNWYHPHRREMFAGFRCAS
ncbi:MAG: SUMF1/EgtB/PvdO family nonheme iron enzyme [Phormidesmis sp.]